MKKRNNDKGTECAEGRTLYIIGSRWYSVKTHFNGKGKDTLGELLLKMMKNDIENNRI